MIPVDADFSQYKMVVAPVLYMVKAGMKEALEAFVKEWRYSDDNLYEWYCWSSQIMYTLADIRDR